ncbi:MAG: GSCFA domain-containing protein [Muribaculaceae bacterium]|nr:GSCFA domain-containing protein [Muribaculaceae bacterium]
MRFRTEIDIAPSAFGISHGTPVVLLGSCFTDEIGTRLGRDGFKVLHNPFGPLYNPASICTCVSRALSPDGIYTEADLTPGPRGVHCLDYASRYSGPDAPALLSEINSTRSALGEALRSHPVVILTMGSAFVFVRTDIGAVVGNCHKFAPSFFERRLLSVSEATAHLSRCTTLLHDAGVEHVIFTVSPIRHLADGLHGNTISKSTLHLAINALADAGATASYFPSYEILLDDLRDYRFYATDMKHPSEQAVDYIYERFAETFFSKDTMRDALAARRLAMAANHRPIL